MISANIATEYEDLFDEQLGTLPATYIMTADPTVSPVVKPARKIPQAMEKNVKEELDNMVKKGVITHETEPTEWVSQMVAARKKNGDVRICLDPRDLNKALRRPHYPMRTADDVASRIGNAKFFSTLDAKAGFWQIRLDKKSSMRTTFSTGVVDAAWRHNSAMEFWQFEWPFISTFIYWLCWRKEGN